MDPIKARELIKDGALLVDVRTPSEYEEHISGAINIPHLQINDRLSEFGSDKERQIVVYCRSGHRSEIAKSMLEKAGYKNVCNGGGYEDLV